MTFTLFICVIIFAISVWYLAIPFLKKQEGEGFLATSQMENLLIQKEETLSSLKELELDHEMKKMNAEEYHELYQETFEQGVNLLKKIDQEKKAEKKLGSSYKGRETTKEEPTAPAPKFCSQCGERLISNARVCSQCGEKI